jgi:D-xylose transport system substrate-binding protein
MRKAMAPAACALLVVIGLTACTDDAGGGRDSGGVTGSRISADATAEVGVILPDSESPRWVYDDPKYLRAAFDAAGVPAVIRNAEGSRDRFLQIADAMIADGARVLMIANIDSATGKTVLDRAKAAGITTIDYDRLTLNGGADYYVSFDSRQVGVLQGRGLVRCLTRNGYDNPVVAQLNGPSTDHTANLIRQGYDSVLRPRYDAAEYVNGPDQPVPDWNRSEARAIFAQMLDQQPRIRGVVAANDTLASAVIEVLRDRGLDGRVPVTGQDATLQGLQNVLAGDQCMTVYKAIKAEAQAAAGLAIAVFNGAAPSTAELDRQKDPESGAYIPFVKLEPIAIDRSTIDRVLKDDFVERNVLCEGRFAAMCERAGI